MSAPYRTAARLAELEDRLSTRDLAVLRSVSDLRFASGNQLARLHFADAGDPTASARAARRALLRLIRLGFLDRLPRAVGGIRSGSASATYALDLGGQQLAIRRGWQPERRRRRSHTPGQLFLAHSLAVAELHVLLTEGDRSGRFELLELAAEPACHRRYGGSVGERWLKPDSFARLGVGEWEVSIWFEIDRGTEGSRAIQAQLERYLAAYRDGRVQAEHGVWPTTLWLTTTPDRAAVIRATIGRLRRADRALFQVGLFADVLTLVGGRNEHEIPAPEVSTNGGFGRTLEADPPAAASALRPAPAHVDRTQEGGRYGDRKSS